MSFYIFLLTRNDNEFSLTPRYDLSNYTKELLSGVHKCNTHTICLDSYDADMIKSTLVSECKDVLNELGKHNKVIVLSGKKLTGILV